MTVQNDDVSGLTGGVGDDGGGGSAVMAPTLKYASDIWSIYSNIMSNLLNKVVYTTNGNST